MPQTASATIKQAPKSGISSHRKDQSADMKVRAQAQAMLERLLNAKEQVKDIHDALKAYKVTSEKLEELKQARKKFTDQVNEEKSKIEAGFQKDKTYNELREKTLDAEEKIALAKQDLRNLLKEEAKKQELVEMELQVNGQPFKLQSQMKVALYFNGKEER